MPDQSSTLEELTSLSEPEFLELDRDVDRMNVEHDFKMAGIHALGAGGFGALAAAAAFSGNPFGALGTVLAAVPAAVYVWKGIQDVGKGVQDAARSAASDATLRLYQQQPGAQVHDAEPAGRVKPLPPSMGLHRH